MRTLLSSLILLAAAPAWADASLQLTVKRSAAPNTASPFGDVGRFDIRNGSAPAGECPGNTNAAGKVTCRLACEPNDPATRNIKIVPPRNERTRGYTTPNAREVSMQGCQLSMAELEFIYKDFALALGELTKDTPLFPHFANAGTGSWSGKFEASSQVWGEVLALPGGAQKLDQLRALTGELALQKSAERDSAGASRWDGYSVGISNLLLKESASRNDGKDAAAKIKVTPIKADFYSNLRIMGDQIEAKDVITPTDARRLEDVNKLRGTTSDKLPAASFKSIAVD